MAKRSTNKVKGYQSGGTVIPPTSQTNQAQQPSQAYLNALAAARGGQYNQAQQPVVQSGFKKGGKVKARGSKKR